MDVPNVLSSKRVVKVRDAGKLRDVHTSQKMKEQNVFGNEVGKSGGGSPFVVLSYCQSLTWLTWGPALQFPKTLDIH